MTTQNNTAANFASISAIGSEERRIAARAQTLRFGIEIETFSRTNRGIRQTVANAIASVVGGTVTSAGSYYDKWIATAPDGRKWTVMTDGSVSGFSAEIVSPILTDRDMSTLQDIVRAVRRAGATVDSTCGIHVHVDATESGLADPNAVCRLAKYVYSKEELILACVNQNAGRYANGQGYGSKRIPETLVSTVLSRKYATKHAFLAAFYGWATACGRNRCSTVEASISHSNHYCDARYMTLNLHAYGTKGTVEFRIFDATLHAGKVRAAVELARGSCARAIETKSARATNRPFVASTAKYDIRAMLLKLGMVGDRYDNVRKHFMGEFAAQSSREAGLRTHRGGGASRRANIVVGSRGNVANFDASGAWTPAASR